MKLLEYWDFHEAFKLEYGRLDGFVETDFFNYTSSLYSLRNNIVTVRSIKPELIDLRSGIHRLVYIIRRSNSSI